MAEHRWTLISDAMSAADGDFEISAREISGMTDCWRVEKRTLRSGLSQGVDIVEIDNGRLKSIILPTRGMGIWRAWADGQELGWQSPVRGPVHPCFVPIAEPSGDGWLCGFDELMCRCGLESNGAPEFNEQGRLLYPLHGRIANLPAYSLELVIDDVKGTISLQGKVEESRYHFQKLRLYTTYTTRFGATSIAWRDEVENFGGCDAGMQMLYHTNVGRPQLGEGSRVVLPVAQIANGDAASSAEDIANWDTYPAPRARFEQQVYYFHLLADGEGRTRALLTKPDNSSAVQLAFSVRELPCFTLWRNLVAEGDGYVTGVEPGTNFPNPRSTEERGGRVVRLQPGERWQADVNLEWLLDQTAVKRSEQAIAVLQGDHSPLILNWNSR
jgi:galactose mutarotase-like enzyme